MDGDGDMDVIAASEGGDRVLWWENNGSGTFEQRHDWTWDGRNGVMKLADSNNDGRPDLWLRKFVSGNTSELWISLCQQDGTYAEPTIALGEEIYLSGVDSVIDLNRDGRMDLLDYYGAFFQQPDGSFSRPPVALPVTQGGESLDLAESPGQTAIGNFGGSGVAQFLSEAGSAIHQQAISSSGSLSPTIAVLSFPPNQRIEWMLGIPPESGGVRDRLVLLISTKVNEEETTNRLVLVTFDESGIGSEVASFSQGLNDANAMYPYGYAWDPATGRLLFSSPASLRENARVLRVSFDGGGGMIEQVLSFTGATRGISLVDLDGDGTRDLLLPLAELSGTSGSFYSHLTWHKGTAAGGYESRARSINQPGFASVIDSAGDIDNDADVDLVTSGGYASHEILVWRNGANGFVRQVVTNDHDSAQVLAVKDLNGDSLKDLLVLTYDFHFPDFTDESGFERIYRFYQQVDGSFQAVEQFQQYHGTKTDFLDMIDLDNDGLEDLLFLQFGNYVVWKRALPNGSYGTETYILFILSLNALKAVDIDRDGDPDLVVEGSIFGEGVFWMENKGAADFSSIHKLRPGVFPLDVDIDGDGFTDFVTQSYYSDKDYYFSRPGVTFEIMQNNPSRFTPTHNFADLDQDGDLDIIMNRWEFISSEFNYISWVENRGGGRFEPQNRNGTDQNRRISPTRYNSRGSRTALADIDGDGTPDLVALSQANQLEWFKITKEPVPAVFGEWMNSRNLRGHSAAPGEDWDGDGLVNWGEFAFGSDPALADLGSPALPRLGQDQEGLGFTYNRRTDASTVGITYTIQCSKFLTDWEPWNPPAQVGQAIGGYERIRVPVTPNQTTEFFRMGVNPPRVSQDE